jgi:hypothetical protein
VIGCKMASSDVCWLHSVRSCIPLKRRRGASLPPFTMGENLRILGCSVRGDAITTGIRGLPQHPGAPSTSASWDYRRLLSLDGTSPCHDLYHDNEIWGLWGRYILGTVPHHDNPSAPGSSSRNIFWDRLQYRHPLLILQILYFYFYHIFESASS